MQAWAIQTAWMLSCRREARRFRIATGEVEKAQAQKLGEIVAANAGTRFGREHGFGLIRSVQDYQRQVPLSNYEDYQAAVARIGRGAKEELTAEPTTLFEPTSGTSGGEKLIPYTKRLGAEFQRAIATWIYDLYASRPALRRGRAYWSISPAFGESRRTPCGIPIGFDDDAAYLRRIERALFSRVRVRPPGIAGVASIEAFRYCTLLWLLRADDLALISIWSPSFLTCLIEALDSWGDELCRDVERGDIAGSCEIEAEIAARLRADLRPDPRRAEALRAILRSGATLPEKLARIWPRLALISCWGDASAAEPARRLRRLFPKVEFQPKGLLATEAFVSIPLFGREGGALALRSHFFEFEPEDGGDSGGAKLAHALSRGERYRVVVTTGGGLYRYRLNDMIEIVGFENECPLIRFVGRGGHVCDLAGEKLSEIHVREVLESVFAEFDLSPRFAVVAPRLDGSPHYCLYLEIDGAEVGIEARLGDALERGLGANPHYRLGTGLGQLAPARVRICGDRAEGFRETYERARAATGQKLGAIKPLALEMNLEIAAALARTAHASEADAERVCAEAPG